MKKRSIKKRSTKKRSNLAFLGALIVYRTYTAEGYELVGTSFVINENPTYGKIDPDVFSKPPLRRTDTEWDTIMTTVNKHSRGPTVYQHPAQKFVHDSVGDIAITMVYPVYVHRQFVKICDVLKNLEDAFTQSYYELPMALAQLMKTYGHPQDFVNKFDITGLLNALAQEIQKITQAIPKVIPIGKSEIDMLKRKS